MDEQRNWIIAKKDLKKRGFKYVGEITIYSHLQACGIINDHDEICDCYKLINEKYPTFVYLSNIYSISFERAYMAAGLSSSMDDYFDPEEAVLVEMK